MVNLNYPSMAIQMKNTISIPDEYLKRFQPLISDADVSIEDYLTVLMNFYAVKNLKRYFSDENNEKLCSSIRDENGYDIVNKLLFCYNTQLLLAGSTTYKHESASAAFDRILDNIKMYLNGYSFDINNQDNGYCDLINFLFENIDPTIPNLCYVIEKKIDGHHCFILSFQYTENEKIKSLEIPIWKESEIVQDM